MPKFAECPLFSPPDDHYSPVSGFHSDMNHHNEVDLYVSQFAFCHIRASNFDMGYTPG